MTKIESEAVTTKWGGKKPASYAHPLLRDGDTDPTKGGDSNYAGCYFINAKANADHPPKIIDAVIMFYTCLGVFFMCQFGRENNDVFFTMMLPVEKHKTVLARIISVSLLELLEIAVCVPIALLRYKVCMKYVLAIAGWTIADAAVSVCNAIG